MPIGFAPISSRRPGPDAKKSDRKDFVGSVVIQMHFSFAAEKVAAQVKAELEAEKADLKRK